MHQIRITQEGHQRVQEAEVDSAGLELNVLIVVYSGPITVGELIQRVRTTNPTYRCFQPLQFAKAVSELHAKGMVVYG